MLLIREFEVNELVSFDDAIKAVEDGFKLLGSGNAVNLPRRRAIVSGAVLHVLQGVVLGDYRVAGLKTYLSTRHGTRFVVVLFSLDSGELLAIIEADRLGQLRTGAASAVATRYMARKDSSVLGIVGAGTQARAQFEALSRVLNLKLVKVFSRTREHAEEFARFIRSRGFDAVVAGDYEDVCRGVDVLVTATNSRDPFIRGSYVVPGMHINAIGSNWANRAELAPDVVLKADVIAVDDVSQAREEAGDLIMAGDAAWSRVVPLADIVVGRVRGRQGDDSVTIFKSLGIAVEDLVLAKLIYDRAVRERRGVEFEFRGVFR
ncbi:ornithine cyclodeaminase family protein [Vulcanisaeta distributa]|uniref:Ornithine cyclodeaminase n=1 Tax=Vulcanisaeta distributa (strain DSM 14429 / JCM 11212 / NBRC 100878 / IC-017) TaxID=572478 RepID=E1QQF9_VULDI|nr:ornithine cyclodeaminase family protein [Vulcanisaeta distributa]ADN50454.1 Ornithine cyclodeaminase [Vulcanisaeta distributa DSM 14429]